MQPRTSTTHPLQLPFVDTPGGGRIGMTFCPGKHDPMAVTGPWARDLDTDLQAIVDWGARALVTLMEQHELEHLGVADLGKRAQTAGLSWFHLPIQDVSVPAAAFEQQWETAGAEFRRKLSQGRSIVVHCRGGLERSGLIAARLLVDMGDEPVIALRRVRKARPGAVETTEQEDYARHLEQASAPGVLVSRL